MPSLLDLPDSGLEHGVEQALASSHLFALGVVALGAVLVSIGARLLGGR